MIKLTKILKEIKTRPKEIIGSGEQGDVYPVGKDKVVKVIGTDDWEPEEIENYKLFNQHPDLFPHVYKIGKNYVIMDRIDSPAKELIEAAEFLHNNGWVDGGVGGIYKMIKYNTLNQLKIFNQILQKAKESNRMDIYNTLKKCLEFFTKLHKILPDEYADTNDGNIGIDRRDGKIKIFDI
jgi:hypothetical protein